MMIHFIPWPWRRPATPGSLPPERLLVVWRGSISKGWGLTTLMGNFHMQYLNTGSSPSCHTIFICIFINRECVGTKHSALMFSSLIHDVSATMKYADATIMKAKHWRILLQVCKLSFSKHLNSCQQKVQKQTKIYHQELPSSDMTNSCNMKNRDT